MGGLGGKIGGNASLTKGGIDAPEVHLNSVCHFVIYIIDIDNCVAGRILKFADDIKIYRTVTSAEYVSASQSDLSKLVAWSKKWQMLFNVETRTHQEIR